MEIDPRLQALIDGGMGDYRLVALEWSPDGGDLNLALRPPGEGTHSITIQLLWVFRSVDKHGFRGVWRLSTSLRVTLHRPAE